MTHDECSVQLLYQDVMNFHLELEASGTTMKRGVIDAGRIQAAVSAPFASFGGVYNYPTVFERAAALWHGIANNHGFNDGNKRTATHSMLCYLAVNGIELEYEQKELSDMAVRIGSGGNNISREEIAAWIEDRAFLVAEDSDGDIPAILGDKDK